MLRLQSPTLFIVSANTAGELMQNIKIEALTTIAYLFIASDGDPSFLRQIDRMVYIS